MKKILVLTAIAATLAFTLIGCGNSSTSTPPPPPTPQPPVVVVPPQEPDTPDTPEVPTAGIGSIKADMDCTGGTITTNYSFGNVPEEDNKKFVMKYQKNGDVVDLTYPSTSTTGSRAVVKDIYYVPENDDNKTAHWIVTIIYQTEGETYDLVTTTITQPKCSSNVQVTSIFNTQAI